MTSLSARTGKVTGRVQGVGFRWSTQRVARRLELVGWVRNLADGRVEVFAQGPADSISELEQWLSHGPAGAIVTSISLHDASPRPGLADFAIR